MTNAEVSLKVNLVMSFMAYADVLLKAKYSIKL